MRPIHIDFSPTPQRNQQIGDYGTTPECVWFKITTFPDKPAYAMACLLHELVEKFLNDQRGITDESVDAFDEANQEDDDPGMLPAAPYHKTHLAADAIERMFILLAGEDWAEYDAAVMELFA